VINRYLKRISVKKVRLSDFRLSVGTVEKGHVSKLVKEFEQFLNEQFASIESDDDTLPVLQVE
jgi:hypothetical protein